MNSQKAALPIAAALAASIVTATSATAFPAFSSTTLNLRAGPGEEFPIIGVMERNVRVDMTGCLPDWSWCVVNVAGLTGWVFAKFVVVDVQGGIFHVGELGEQGRVPVVGADGVVVVVE